MKLSTIAALRAGVSLTPVKKHPGHSDQKVHGRGRRGAAAKAAKFDGPEVKDWDDVNQVKARAEAIDEYNAKHGGDWATGERFDTEYLYKREDGSYTPQRAAMHDQIVDELMAKNADVPADGQAVVLAGPPGAGKTSILKKSENGVADAVGVELNADGSFKSHAGENSDDIKSIMADKGMVPVVDGASAGEMVNLVHEESSHISKMYHNRLLAEKKNVVIDGTLGGTNEQKQIDKISSTKRAGYEMRAIMVDTDPEMAIESASNRWVGGEKRGDKHGGRYVPPAVTEAESRPTGRVPGAKTANRENFEILTRPGSGVDFEETFVFDNSKTPQHPNGYGNVLLSHRIGGREQVNQGNQRLQQLGAPPVLSNLPGGTQGRAVTGGDFQGRDTGLTGPMFAKQESYKPTAGMIAEAKRGLEWRREFNRGGTAVGVARARDISNGKSLSLSTVKRMHSFFARHEVDKKGKGFNRGEPGYPSAGRIAWALWGGDAGFAWSRQISQRDKNVSKAVSASVRDGLQRKVEEHNEKHGDAASKKVTLRMLSSVFERGVGAYKTNPQSVRPNVKSPDQWAYARVNTFLRAVRTGRFPGGKFDTDLLPSGHKLSTRKSLEEPMRVGKLANGDYVLVKHPGHQDQKSHGRRATYAGEATGVRRGGVAAVNEGNSQGFKPTAQSRRIIRGEANSPKTGKPISEDAQSAHRSYTEGNTANAVNKKLRTRNENLSPEERSVQTGMDKAFNEASFELQQPRTVYRSETKRVGSAATGDSADLIVGNKIKQNDVTVDLGFMSTRENSVDAAGDMEAIGRQGFGQQVQVNYAINVPAGTRMLAGNESQGETILDRGSQLRVTKVTKSGPNKVDVEAEVFSGTAQGGSIPRAQRPTPDVVPGIPARGQRSSSAAYSIVPSERAGTESPESRLGQYGEGFGKAEGDAGSAAPKVRTGRNDLASLGSRVSILLWRRTGIVKHPGHADQKSHGRKRRSGQSASGQLLGEDIPASEGDVRGFTTANYPSQALAYSTQKSTLDSMDSEAGIAHRGYIGSEHAQINGFLRDPDGPMTSRSDTTTGGMPLPVKQARVDNLDKAFSQDNMGVELTRDAKLYRGVQADRSIDAHPMSKLEAGDEFTDLGFTSTSTNTAVTRDFIDRDARGESEGIQFNITAPAGTTVIGGMDAEQELILPRGSKFRVTGKTRLQGQDQDDPDTWMGTENGRPVFDEYNENWSGGSKDILVVDVELIESKPVYKSVPLFKHPGHQDQKAHGRRGTSTGGGVTDIEFTNSAGQVRDGFAVETPIGTVRAAKMKNNYSDDAEGFEEFARDAYEMQIETKNGTYIVEADYVHFSEFAGGKNGTVDSTIYVMTPEAGMETAGTLQRVLNDGRSEGKPAFVKNDIMEIYDDHTGNGVGTTMLRHHEGQLAAAGFEYQRVQAVSHYSMNGAYTWAKYGYKPDEGQSDLHFGDFARQKQFSDFGLTAAEKGFWDSTRQRSTLEAQGKSLIDAAAVSPDFRDSLIQQGDWNGTMDLRPHAAMSKAEQDVVAVIARWQLEDPVGYENDVPEMWEEIRAASVKTAKSVSFFKHPGHQDQKSHGRRAAGSGGGSGKATSAKEAIKLSTQKRRNADENVRRELTDYVDGNNVNDKLRHSDFPEDFTQIAVGANQIDNMDRAFSSEQLGVEVPPITVMRGMGFAQDSESGKMWENVKEGDEFVDKGFVSTTTGDSGVEQRFMEDAKGTRVEAVIRLKDGQTVIAGSGEEREIILPRNSRFKVTYKTENTRFESNTIAGGFDSDKPETWGSEQKTIRINLDVVDAPTVYKSISFFKHPGHADQKVHGRRSATRVQGYKKELAQRAYGEGGGTWDWRNESFVDDGKIVALEAYEGRYSPPAGGWTEESVADSIVDWSKSPDVQQGLRSRTDANVGMWLDEDSGDLFLDVSVKLTGASPEQASRLARRENQLAWWDGDNQQLYVRNDAGNYVSETVD
jgi:hypothetical protein